MNPVEPEVNGQGQQGVVDGEAPNVTWIEHATLDEMYLSAGQEAAVRAGSKFPASIIREGDRRILNASIPIRELIEFTRSDTPRGSTLEGVQKSYNRPLDSDHAKEFASYIVDNIADPFIPSFSLNSSEPITIHYVPKYNNHEV